jgi:hypothetical protein
VIDHLNNPADAVENGLGGYNFYTTATLRTPQLSINKSAAGMMLSWNAISGASYYKIWTKANPYSSEAWSYVGSTSSRTFNCTGADPMGFYRITAH